MVKRKATESLDEWLLERRTTVEVPQPTTEVTSEPRITSPLPTSETTPPQVASEPVTEAPAAADVTEEGAADWFWSLLEHAGFERW